MSDNYHKFTQILFDNEIYLHFVLDNKHISLRGKPKLTNRVKTRAYATRSM